MSRDIYLRHRAGGPIGPLNIALAAVLYERRVIDESTPVSFDGVTFHALRDHRDLIGALTGSAASAPTHVAAQAQAQAATHSALSHSSAQPIAQPASPPPVASGPPRPSAIPRPSSAPRPHPSAGPIPSGSTASAPASRPAAAPAPAPAAPIATPVPVAAPAAKPAAAQPTKAATPLRPMLSAAIDKASGKLPLFAPQLRIDLVYKDGRIVAIETQVHEYSLFTHFMETKHLPAEALIQIEQESPRFGGDFAATVMGLGLLSPHIYLEQCVVWAHNTLMRAIRDGFQAAQFQHEDVKNPPVPLKFDRLAIFAEIVRTVYDLGTLHDHFNSKRGSPLILSHVEGATLDDFQLPPGELRIIKSIDGSKSVGEVLEAFGGSDQRELNAMRALYFATELGFAVIGENRQHARDAQEAQRLRELFAGMRDKTFFEVLDVKETTTDAEVRKKYTDLAKVYHPDRVRRDALQELHDVNREIFAKISEAFEALQTDELRKKHTKGLKEGTVMTAAQIQQVNDVLQSETVFRKAEILAKVRKFAEALEQIDQAIKLKPDDHEFKIFREYYNFMAKPGGPAQAEAAIKNIQTLMKAGPELASAYMFLGHLNKAAGKPNEAIKAFQKLLTFDPKNTEAMREVRLANMRDEKSKKKFF